jgi:hypothetical protein
MDGQPASADACRLGNRHRLSCLQPPRLLYGPTRSPDGSGRPIVPRGNLHHSAARARTGAARRGTGSPATQPLFSSRAALLCRPRLAGLGRLLHHSKHPGVEGRNLAGFSSSLGEWMVAPCRRASVRMASATPWAAVRSFGSVPGAGSRMSSARSLSLIRP